MHHFFGDVSSISTSELEEKSRNLQKKYHMTSNQQVKEQMAAGIEYLNQVIQERRQIEYEKAQQDRNTDFDDLINVG